MPSLARIDHVALTVTDLDISVAFYSRLLGAEPIATLNDGPFVRTLFDLPGGSHLGLTRHDHGSGQQFEPTTPGLDHLALAVPDRAALDAWVGHLDELAIHHNGIVAADYGLVLSFADPDGVALELFLPA